MGRKNVFDFNHVASIPDSQMESLKKLYAHYHKQAVCYGWSYKRLRRLQVGLEMSSTFLTVVGAATSPLSMITLVVFSIGVGIRAYSDAKSLSSKVEKYRLTHTIYLKVLDDLRGYLRGIPYDEKVLISDLRVIDQTVNDICPPISEKLSQRYNNTYSTLQEDLKAPLRSLKDSFKEKHKYLYE